MGSWGHDHRNYDDIFRKSHHESERNRVGIFLRNLPKTQERKNERQARALLMYSTRSFKMLFRKICPKINATFMKSMKSRRKKKMTFRSF